MQVCNNLCQRSSVPRGDPRKNIYETKVYCRLCECYFMKPYPSHCECCTTLVRHVKGGRLRKQKYDYSYGFRNGRSRWIVEDIKAAVAAGRL